MPAKLIYYKVKDEPSTMKRTWSESDWCSDLSFTLNGFRHFM